jgi:hypothetical protein
MKKVITFLFLINLVATIAWFNYQVYYKFTETTPVAIQYQETKEQQWITFLPAKEIFQKNLILELLLKRI